MRNENDTFGEMLLHIEKSKKRNALQDYLGSKALRCTKV